MYDVKMHLPQQIEYMLAAEREGELDKFEMAVYNLKEMFKMSRWLYKTLTTMRRNGKGI